MNTPGGEEKKKEKEKKKQSDIERLDRKVKRIFSYLNKETFDKSTTDVSKTLKKIGSILKNPLDTIKDNNEKKILDSVTKMIITILDNPSHFNHIQIKLILDIIVNLASLNFGLVNGKIISKLISILIKNEKETVVVIQAISKINSRVSFEIPDLENVLYYFGFYYLPGNNKDSKIIPFISQLAESTKVPNLYFSEYLFNLIFLNYCWNNYEIYSYLNENKNKAKTNETEKEHSKKIDKKIVEYKFELFKFLYKLYFSIRVIPAYIHQKMIKALLLFDDNKINIPEYKEITRNFFQKLEENNKIKPIFFSFLINYLQKYSIFEKEDNVKKNSINQHLDNNESVFQEFHLDSTKITLLTNFREELQKQFKKIENVLIEKINIKNQRYTEGSEFILTIFDFLKDYLFKKNDKDTMKVKLNPLFKNKYFFNKILTLYVQQKIKGYQNKMDQFIQELILIYRKLIAEEWENIITLLYNKSTDNLKEITEQITEGTFQGQINSAKKLFLSFDLKKSLESNILWIKFKFDSDNSFFQNLEEVITKTLDFIEKKSGNHVKKEEKNSLLQTIFYYINFYYNKNLNEEIFISELENKLEAFLPQILEKLQKLEMDTNLWGNLVKNLFVQTHNLNFMRNVLKTIFENEDLLCKKGTSCFLTETITNENDITYQIPKLQILIDVILSNFNNFEIKENNETVLLIISHIKDYYYVTDDCKLYFTQKMYRNSLNDSKIIVDNNYKVDNKINTSNAYYNFTKLFSFISHYISNFQHKTDNKSIRLNLISLCDVKLYICFAFYKNANLKSIIEQFNNLFSYLQIEDNENDNENNTNETALTETLHFLSNLNFFIHCELEYPNPFDGLKLIKQKYNLLKNSNDSNLKISILDSIIKFTNQLIEKEKEIKNKEQIITEEPKKSLLNLNIIKKKTHHKEIPKPKEEGIKNINMLIHLIHYLEFFCFSLYDYETNSNLPKQNSFTNQFIGIQQKEKEIVINKDNLHQKLKEILAILFNIRNLLTDKDYLLGFAIINFLYTNKELICTDESILPYVVFLLLSLGWYQYSSEIQFFSYQHFNRDSEYFDFSDNKFNYGSFHFYCDYLLNYFLEQTTKGNQFLQAFQKIFDKIREKKLSKKDAHKNIEKSQQDQNKRDFENKRADIMIEMLKWNLSSKNLRDNLKKKNSDIGKEEKIYKDGLNIISIAAFPSSAHKFDVIIRSPISNISFTIEKPTDEFKGIEQENNCDMLCQLINGEKPIKQSEKKEEKKKIRNIDQIINNDSFLFQRIYKYNKRESIKIPFTPDTELKKKIREIDSISVYKIYQCNVLFQSNTPNNFSLQFINFINSLGMITNTEEEIKANSQIDITFQDINNTVKFTIPTKNEVKYKYDNLNKIKNYVCIIWEENNAEKEQNFGQNPVTIKVIPYSNEYHLIKLSTNGIDEIETLFMNEVVIYTGKNYEILSNYLIKLVIKINDFVAFYSKKNKIEEVEDDSTPDNVYTRYDKFIKLMNFLD